MADKRKSIQYRHESDEHDAGYWVKQETFNNETGIWYDSTHPGDSAESYDYDDPDLFALFDKTDGSPFVWGVA